MKDYNTSIKTKTAGPTQLTNFKIPSYRHVIITLRKITSYACSTVQEFGRLEYIIKPVAMKSKKKKKIGHLNRILFPLQKPSPTYFHVCLFSFVWFGLFIYFLSVKGPLKPCSIKSKSLISLYFIIFY